MTYASFRCQSCEREWPACSESLRSTTPSINASSAVSNDLPESWAASIWDRPS